MDMIEFRLYLQERIQRKRELTLETLPGILLLVETQLDFVISFLVYPKETKSCLPKFQPLLQPKHFLSYKGWVNFGG
jgi:hypothetical protein